MEGEKFSLAPASDENGGVWMGDSYAPIIFQNRGIPAEEAFRLPYRNQLETVL